MCPPSPSDPIAPQSQNGLCSYALAVHYPGTNSGILRYQVEEVKQLTSMAAQKLQEAEERGGEGAGGVFGRGFEVQERMTLLSSEKEVTCPVSSYAFAANPRYHPTPLLQIFATLLRRCYQMPGTEVSRGGGRC